MKIIILIIILSSIISCGTLLPPDISYNYAEKNYHSIEFDISKKNEEYSTEYGIANIYLDSNSDMSKKYIQINGIYKGTLHLYSNACSVNIDTPFDGKTIFKLSDIIPYPIKCSLKITAISDKIFDKENNIVESGIIKINVLPNNVKPLIITYYQQNFLSKNPKEYLFQGQGSMQRISGPLSSYEKFTIKTDSNKGGIYKVMGCGNSLQGSYAGDTFDVSLHDLYKKDNLDIADSCDFEISALPYDQQYSLQSRFSLNIYSKDVIKLEPLGWKIEPDNNGKKFLYLEGKKYISLCIINDKYKLNLNSMDPFKCREEYYSNKEYWVRSITVNGRKNVFAIKNGDVIWHE